MRQLIGDANFDPKMYQEVSYLDQDNKKVVEQIRNLYCDSEWSHFSPHLLAD